MRFRELKENTVSTKTQDSKDVLETTGALACALEASALVLALSMMRNDILKQSKMAAFKG